MANANTPFGFKVAGHRSGGVPRHTTYNIAYNYATAIYSGDAVVLTSGKLAIGAADSALILGIFDGCSYKDNTGAQIFSRYWPGVALTDTAAVVTAYVYTDRGIVFEAQTSTAVAYVDATHVGTKCDLVATAGATATTGQSSQELTMGTTGDEQFIVLGLVNRPDNAVGANAKVLCAINDATLG